MVILVFTLICLALVHIIFRTVKPKKESFSSDIPIVINMNETDHRRSQFASALLNYDPQLMKYQDPRKFDFHLASSATQIWKNGFKKHIRGVADEVLQNILTYNRVIVLFDKSDLVGNVIFLPLEGQFPLSIKDDVLFKKYIKWEPPSNIISAIVPPGFRVRIDFAIEGRDQAIQSQYIFDGITKTFVIAQPVKSIVIEKIL